MRFLLAAAASTAFAGVAVAVSDQFSINNLVTTSNKGHEHHRGNNIVTFEVQDWSVEPAEMTSCTVSFKHGPYWPAKPILCEDNWFAFQIYRFGGLHDFELELHHAYGRDCKFCNDPWDERYDGITGSATFQISEDMNWDSTGVDADETETSQAKDEISVDIVFDHGRTFYD